MPLREESFTYLMLPGHSPSYREVRIVIKGRSHGGAVCLLTPSLVLALFSFKHSNSVSIFIQLKTTWSRLGAVHSGLGTPALNYSPMGLAQTKVSRQFFKGCFSSQMALLWQKKVTRTQTEHKVTHKCFSELSAEEISRNAYIWNLTLGGHFGCHMTFACWNSLPAWLHIRSSFLYIWSYVGKSCLGNVKKNDFMIVIFSLHNCLALLLHISTWPSLLSPVLKVM